MAVAPLGNAQLHAALIAIQHQLNENIGIVNGLQAAAAAAVPLPGGGGGGGNAIRVGSARAPAVAPYDGSKGLDEFLLVLRNMDRWYGYVQDRDRIRFLCLNLAGPALSYLETPAGIAALALDAWAPLEAALRARFQPVTTEEVARAEIFSIVQGPKGVHEYTSQFNHRLAFLPDQDDATTLHHYLRGLKAPIREQLRISGVHDLVAAQTMAVRIGNPMPFAGSAGTAVPMDLGAIDASSPTDQPGLIAAVTEAVLAAMRTGSVRNHGSGGGSSKWGGRGTSGGGPRPAMIPDGLSAEERQKYYAEGRCFLCGKTGHNKPQCPTRSSSSSSSSSAAPVSGK